MGVTYVAGALGKEKNKGGRRGDGGGGRGRNARVWSGGKGAPAGCFIEGRGAGGMAVRTTAWAQGGQRRALIHMWRTHEGVRADWAGSDRRWAGEREKREGYNPFVGFFPSLLFSFSSRF